MTDENPAKHPTIEEGFEKFDGQFIDCNQVVFPNNIIHQFHDGGCSRLRI